MTTVTKSRSITAKSADEASARHKLQDYDQTRAAFSWAQARADLGDVNLNIVDVAIDRHVRSGLGSRPALRWRGREGMRQDVTFAELQTLSRAIQPPTSCAISALAKTTWSPC